LSETAQPEAFLVVSLLAAAERPRVLALAELVARHGPLFYLSRPLPFDWTDYYRDEMGPGLSRRLAAFEQPVGWGALAMAKDHCQALEARLAKGGKRTVNLDPGLLHEGGLILASAKWAPHRLPLGPGLFQELTLYFAGGCYNALPWTYRDYAGEPLNPVLGLLRRRLLWRGGGRPKTMGETNC